MHEYCSCVNSSCFIQLLTLVVLGPENAAPDLNVANVLYTLPIHSTNHHKPEEHSPKLVPTDTQGEDGKYMELSDAIIAPSEYLCPNKTVT